MKHAFVFVALLAQWAALVCVAAGSSNSTQTQAQVKAAKTKTKTKEPWPCMFDNKPVSNVGRYLVGHRKLRGSIYARCHKGKLVCYVDNGWSDQPLSRAKTVDCKEVRTTREKFHQMRRLGVLVDQVARKWPKGVACYRFGSTFYQNEVDLFKTAFAEYEEKTLIRFVEINKCKDVYGDDTQVCGGCQNYFSIVNEEGEDSCEAIVGFAPAQEMKLNVGPKCAQLEVYLHELGHVLGLQHEHIHPQREVIILPNKIAFAPNEYIRDTKDPVTPYNRMSIMHYNDGSMCVPRDLGSINAFCDTNRQTPGCTIPSDDYCDHSQDNTFGKSLHLTPGDIDSITKLYRAPSNDILTSAEYLGSTQALGDDGNAAQQTTQAPTEAPTQPPTEAPTAPPTEAPTEAPTPPPTTTAPTPPPTTPAPTTPAPTTPAPTTPAPTTPAPTTPVPTTQAPTPAPVTQTGDKTCTEQVSEGDKAVGIDVVTDASCVRGGIGCFKDVCRYCRRSDSDKSAAFMQCSQVPNGGTNNNPTAQRENCPS